MQIVGYELGTGAGKLFGEIAEWAGFALLAAVGAFMIRESFKHSSEPAFDLTRGSGCWSRRYPSALIRWGRLRAAGGRHCAGADADYGFNHDHGFHFFGVGFRSAHW